ncbi:MAG: hypothetical protein Kow0062_25400 [Acidobacteriota bacterium]
MLHADRERGDSPATATDDRAATAPGVRGGAPFPNAPVAHDAPADPARLARIIEHVVAEVRRGDARPRTVTVRIGDADGDTVLLRFRRHGDALRVQLVAADPAHAAELARDLPHLRQALSASGTRVDVDLASGGHPHPDQAADAHGRAAPDTGGTSRDRSSTSPVERRAGAPGRRGMLDVLA